ncbi:hypothetical protein D3C85_1608920 [compost metagenome]
MFVPTVAVGAVGTPSSVSPAAVVCACTPPLRAISSSPPAMLLSTLMYMLSVAGLGLPT